MQVILFDVQGVACYKLVPLGKFLCETPYDPTSILLYLSMYALYIFSVALVVVQSGKAGCLVDGHDEPALAL